MLEAAAVQAGSCGGGGDGDGDRGGGGGCAESICCHRALTRGRMFLGGAIEFLEDLSFLRWLFYFARIE